MHILDANQIVRLSVVKDPLADNTAQGSELVLIQFSGNNPRAKDSLVNQKIPTNQSQQTEIRCAHKMAGNQTKTGWSQRHMSFQNKNRRHMTPPHDQNVPAHVAGKTRTQTAESLTIDV